MSTRKPYLKEPRYVTTLAVWVPCAEALVEGCRYDSCYPASERDAIKISHLIAGQAADSDHIVRLVRVARTDAPPTVDRWRSFGAYVLDARHPQESPLTDDELANLARVNRAINPDPVNPVSAS